jgi:hypothetical protein
MRVILSRGLGFGYGM